MNNKVWSITGASRGMGREPPLRFILGNTNVPLARKSYAARLAT